MLEGLLTSDRRAEYGNRSCRESSAAARPMVFVRQALLHVVACCLLTSSVCQHSQAAVENLFLVVNTNSWASRAIANHYIQLRQVPDRNVLHLDYVGPVDRIDLDRFQSDILNPVIRAMEARKVADRIEYLVYSADFPYAVDFSARIEPGAVGAAGLQVFAVASLTGLTYLHEKIGSRGHAFDDLASNDYAVKGLSQGQSTSLSVYRARTGLAPIGGLPRFPVSTMLGYCAGRGNSIGEIASSLRRSALAESSHPQGTIYYMQNEDIRSKVRSPMFPRVVPPLQQAGIQAAVAVGTVPPANSVVAGAMLGSPGFQWDPTSRILPGAICENFTSYGGILSEDAQQTPLSDLVRAGASGSSGTVVEPYAIPNKFPHPGIQVHYVMGCTLGESFYQSVIAPYQLLVVGDPLCRPWGLTFQVGMEGIADEAELKGDVDLKPIARLPENLKLGGFDLYLDGVFLTRVNPDQSFPLDTMMYADGFHRISVVGSLLGNLEYESRRDVEVYFRNSPLKAECRRSSSGPIYWGETVSLDVSCSGCKRVAIVSQGRVISTIQGETGRLAVSSKLLSMGPTSVQAVGYSDEGHRESRSAELRFDIRAPRLMRGQSAAGFAGALPGVRLTRPDGTANVVKSTSEPNWMAQAGIRDKGRFELNGILKAPNTELYQLRADLEGQISVNIDGRVVHSGNALELRYGLPLHLEAGAHLLSCRIQLTSTPQGTLTFGNQGTQGLGEKNCICHAN